MIETAEIVANVSLDCGNKKISGKRVVVDLKDIHPQGGLLNSEISVIHGGKSYFVRYAVLELTNSSDRAAINHAITIALNAAKTPEPKKTQNLKRYRVPQLSFN